MLLGSSIFVSAFVVSIRSRAFELRFQEVIAEQKLQRERRRSSSPSLLRLPFSRRNSAMQSNGSHTETGSTPPMPQTVTSLSSPRAPNEPDARRDSGQHDDRDMVTEQAAGSIRQSDAQVTWANTIPVQSSPITEMASPPATSNNIKENPPKVVGAPSSLKPLGGTILQPRHQHVSSHLFSPHGVGARFAHIAFSQTQKSDEELVTISKSYVRNSETAHLTHMERLRLGGVEYRATRLLVWIVPAYFILWQLFGCIGLGAWITNNTPSTARSNGLNPFWAGAFNGVSAFNNNGYSLIDANMTAFQTSDYMLITMALMILAGNTCYPIFLRMIVWGFLKLTPESWTEEKESLLFLLNHPRRCYTNLFPLNDTWWLLLAVIGLNGIDWAGFLVLNVSSPLRFPGRHVKMGGFSVTMPQDSNKLIANTHNCKDRQSRFQSYTTSLKGHRWPFPSYCSSVWRFLRRRNFVSARRNSIPVYNHDVHLGISCDYNNAKHECLRRAQPRDLC